MVIESKDFSQHNDGEEREDERAYFVPPKEDTPEDADQARSERLNKIIPTGNIIDDARAFFEAEGSIPPKIVEDGNEARVLNLLQQRYDGCLPILADIQQESFDHPNHTTSMSWQEKDLYKSSAATLKTILEAYQSNQK
jgi:hypothetical protein